MRGHDESKDSKNYCNFLELLKLMTSYDQKIASMVLENTLKNASYTSPNSQKEIL